MQRKCSKFLTCLRRIKSEGREFTLSGKLSCSTCRPSYTHHKYLACLTWPRAVGIFPVHLRETRRADETQTQRKHQVSRRWIFRTRTWVQGEGAEKPEAHHICSRISIPSLTKCRRGHDSVLARSMPRRRAHPCIGSDVIRGWSYEEG